MSTHPNAILMVAFKPDGLARKTYRAILDELAIADDDDTMKLGSKDYRHMVMESDYDDGYQIAADEGDIVFHDYITYGYGECVSWPDLEKQKNELEEWAKGVCQRHSCAYAIYVTANYW